MLVSGLIAGSSFEDDDVVVAGGGGEAGGGAFQPIQAGEKVGLARYQVSQVAGGQPEAEAVPFHDAEPGAEMALQSAQRWIPDGDFAGADAGRGRAAQPPQGSTKLTVRGIPGNFPGTVGAHGYQDDAPPWTDEPAKDVGQDCPPVGGVEAAEVAEQAVVGAGRQVALVAQVLPGKGADIYLPG